MTQIRIPNINLRHGDCMDLMRETPDGHYDLAVVDPPFGIGADWKKHMARRVKHGERTYKNDAVPNPEYFEELFRVSKNQIIWGYNYYANMLPISNNLIVWDKCATVDKSFKSEGELAWTSVKKWPFRIVTIEWDGARKPTEPFTKTIHPHQKPVALYSWLLQNYAKPGDRILDTHGGSMSIAIACYDLGFDLDLTELDADYYRDGVARFERHRAQGQLFHAPAQQPEQARMF